MPPAQEGLEAAARVREAVDGLYRTESRRVFATLVRLLGDFDIAEEALHDAFRAALEQWPREGVPANPRAWLVSTGRFKAIDGIRRNSRFDAVLRVVYLVFNEGYSASSGASITRADLSAEAIRLARLLVELLPEPEALGMLALMLLHESRRAARTSPSGDLILLDDQDRGLWNRDMIAEGASLVEKAFASRRFGAYTLQAAIAAIHAEAPNATATDWREIVGRYDLLMRLPPSPIVDLNPPLPLPFPACPPP